MLILFSANGRTMLYQGGPGHLTAKQLNYTGFSHLAWRALVQRRHGYRTLYYMFVCIVLLCRFCRKMGVTGAIPTICFITFVLR